MTEFDRAWPIYQSSKTHAYDLVLALFPDMSPQTQKELAKDLIWELRNRATTQEHFQTLKAKATNKPAPGFQPLSAAAPLLSPSTRLDLAADPKELIAVWRKLQAQADHRTAEMLRAKVHEFLESPCNSLSASEMRQIAGALADIQRVQRLALGLSPDNPGIPVKDELESKGVEVRFVPRNSTP